MLTHILQNEQKSAFQGELALKQATFENQAKELTVGGRLAEGLRARAKERTQLLAEHKILQERIAELKGGLKALRFTAFTAIPGTDVIIKHVHAYWLQMRKNISRDKSKAKAVSDDRQDPDGAFRQTRARLRRRMSHCVESQHTHVYAYLLTADEKYLERNRGFFASKVSTTHARAYCLQMRKNI